MTLALTDKKQTLKIKKKLKEERSNLTSKNDFPSQESITFMITFKILNHPQ